MFQAGAEKGAAAAKKCDGACCEASKAQAVKQVAAKPGEQPRAAAE